MITAHLPAAKKIIVHGVDVSLPPQQFVVHEDTQFKVILQESCEYFNITDDLDNYQLADAKTSECVGLGVNNSLPSTKTHYAVFVWVLDECSLNRQNLQTLVTFSMCCLCFNWLINHWVNITIVPSVYCHVIRGYQPMIILLECFHLLSNFMEVPAYSVVDKQSRL